MSSFTYIISSLDDLSNPSRASNCYINFGGLPQGIKYFRCRVLNFNINTISILTNYLLVADGHFIQLTSDNFILSGGRSGNKSLNTIATFSVDNSGRSGEVFTIENLNGKTINFKLLNEYEQQIDNVINNNTFNTVWMLTLELTPIDEY